MSGSAVLQSGMAPSPAMDFVARPHIQFSPRLPISMPKALRRVRKRRDFTAIKKLVKRWYFGSAVLTSVGVVLTMHSGWIAAIFLVTSLVDLLASLLARNICNPPFMIHTTPEEGLTQDLKRICPYWPEKVILGPKAMSLRHENVEFPTENDCTLRGWLIRPWRVRNLKKTVLIFSHGAGRDRRAWLRHCPFFLGAGYTCLLFDFRNHGTSDTYLGGGTFLGLTEWEDMRAAARYVKQRFPKMMAAFVGTSTGAVSATIAVVQDPEVAKHIRCIVAENPFSSIRKMAQYVVSNVGFRILLCKKSRLAYFLCYPAMLIVRLFTVAKIQLELTKAGRFRVPSCLQAAKKAPVPMLIMHGTDDQIVPAHHRRQIFRACTYRKKEHKHETWECEGAGHCQLWDKDPQKFEALVLDFLRRHCE